MRFCVVRFTVGFGAGLSITGGFVDDEVTFLAIICPNTQHFKQKQSTKRLVRIWYLAERNKWEKISVTIDMEYKEKF